MVVSELAAATMIAICGFRNSYRIILKGERLVRRRINRPSPTIEGYHSFPRFFIRRVFRAGLVIAMRWEGRAKNAAQLAADARMRARHASDAVATRVEDARKRAEDVRRRAADVQSMAQEKAARVRERAAEVRQRAGEVTDAAKDRAAAAKDRVVAAKDRVVAAKDRVVAAKDRVVAAKDRVVEIKNRVQESVSQSSEASSGSRKISAEGSALAGTGKKEQEASTGKRRMHSVGLLIVNEEENVGRLIRTRFSRN